MINLDNSQTLQDVLKRLPPGALHQTPNSVLTYVLLEQYCNTYLAVIAYGIEGIWSRWFVSSQNTQAGVKFLLPLGATKEVLGNLNSAYALSIKAKGGRVVVETSNQVVAGRAQVLDRLSIQAFAGDLAEFNYPSSLQLILDDESAEAVVTQSNLAEFVWQLTNFSDLTAINTNAGAVLVTFDAAQQVIRGYAKQPLDSSFIIQASCPAVINTTESWSCVLLGVHFMRLGLLRADQIRFRLAGANLVVSCVEGTLLLPIQELESYSYLSELPESFLDLPEYRTHVVWHLSLNRLNEALVAQQPDTTYTNRHISLRDDQTSLALGKQADLLTKDYSNIDLLGRSDLVVTDAAGITILLSASGLLKALKVFKHVLSAYKLNADDLAISVFSVELLDEYTQTPESFWSIRVALIEPCSVGQLPIVIGGIKTRHA
jgi:hypothetical protein